jgi:glycosyltransferase involved in cell wall biosynthesis
VSDSATGTQAQIARRWRQLNATWRAEGVHGVALRTRRALSTALAPQDALLPVRDEDVLAADLGCPPIRRSVPYVEGERLTINWVMTPPAKGSGGHTTVFRVLNHLEACGHRNRVIFYDVHRSDHRYFADIVRQYYGFAGPVTDIDHGLPDAHVAIATGWPTAYPLFASTSAGKRCYFVQDFEPDFHPMGCSNVLAENTYRMGFHGITAGSWLSQRLQARYGMPCDSFDFGCDLTAYSRMESSPRKGICFYVRPSAPRRASEIGLMAVELFARRRPDVEINLYGDALGRRSFDFVDHGHVTPADLNAIYNRSIAGLSLSLTNVSLVPHEMLAAGCIPVVNDAEQNRLVLNNPHVRYADLTPHALADALEAVVADPGSRERSLQASRSVRSTSWADAGAKMEAVLHRLLRA